MCPLPQSRHNKEDLTFQRHPTKRKEMPPKVLSGIFGWLAVRPSCLCILKSWKDSKKQTPLPWFDLKCKKKVSCESVALGYYFYSEYINHFILQSTSVNMSISHLKLACDESVLMLGYYLSSCFECPKESNSSVADTRVTNLTSFFKFWLVPHFWD